jgi:hypothetical protein
MLLAVAVQHFRTYTLVREAARLERHRDDLVMGNAALRVEIQRLRTDDRYIERLAREQLGMLRPGEMEMVVIPTADQHPTGQDPTTARARQHGEGPRSIESLAHEVVRSVLAFLENMLGPRPPGTR